MTGWQPNSECIQIGQEAYIQYLSGVAILNTPYSSFARGTIGEGIEHPDAIILHSEQLMYDGLRSVIAQANPPAMRADLQKYAEHRFFEALPVMLRIVDSAYTAQGVRINSMNAAFPYLRPMPAYDESMYHHLCHSRKGKIRTRTLLDGIQEAAIFSDALTKRCISDTVVYDTAPAS
jgi:hypothetical protein